MIEYTKLPINWPLENHMSARATSELNFENAYQELEAIVERMERGEQDLESSLSDFERGVVLMKHCHGVLKEAEQKVSVLVKDNDGLFSTETFEENN